MNEYLVSYCDYESGRQVAADGSVSMSLQEVLVLMDEILVSPGTEACASMCRHLASEAATPSRRR